MKHSKLTCTEARQIDLVDYLATLGHQPQKIRGNEYWYLSPLREERTPSFKVNRTINAWFDFGLGKGGNTIDFGVLYHQCSVAGLLDQLQSSLVSHQTSFSFHRHWEENTAEQDADEKKIKVIGSFFLSSHNLCRYLEQRKIPPELADNYCREIRYTLNKKTFYAIGFPNDSGGYELRNAYFKGSSSPKDITFINNHAPEIVVFEGFFNFLSFLAYHQTGLLLDKENEGFTVLKANYLILNSLAFFEKSLSLMQQHRSIHLYLDRDTAGMNCTRQALKISSQFKDESAFYRGYNDLNDWLAKRNQRQIQQIKQAQNQGRHFRL